MGELWQVSLFYMLIYACHVSLAFQLSTNTELGSEIDDEIAQNPLAHDFAAEEHLNENPSVTRTPQKPQGPQMDDPLVHNPGMQVPQRRLTNFFGAFGNQHAEFSPQKPPPSDVDPSGSLQTSQTNDPLVQRTGVQVPQRRLTSFFGALSNQYGESSPQRPTAAKKPQSALAHPSRSLQASQTNDPLVQRTGVQVPQRRMTSFIGALGWTSPQHPTATQKPPSNEANNSRRPSTRWLSKPLGHAEEAHLPHRRLINSAGVWINPQSSGSDSSQTQASDPLVHNPGVQVPQRRLNTFVSALGNHLGNVNSFSQLPEATTTQRPQSSGTNLYSSWAHLMNDPLVDNPGVLSPGKAHQSHPSELVTGQQHQQKPLSPRSSGPRQEWQRPPAQTFSQGSQVTALKNHPKDLRTEVQPVTPDSVQAVCGEKTLQLTVKMDFLGTGHLIDPEDITLGGCAPTGFVESQQELLFETPLHECGATVQVSAGIRHLCLLKIMT